MERLLEEAEELTGIHYDISSLGDVYSAIHAIQNDMMISGYTVEELSQKLTDMSLSQTEVTRVAQQMGITYEDALARMQAGTLTVQDAQILLGTTAKEAGSTIEGSMGSLSAAWENLVVGFARSDSDLDTLINNVVSSAEGAFKNLLPIAKKALSGIGDFVVDIAPKIGEKLPDLITEILPDLVITGASFVSGLATGVVQALPTLIENVKTGFSELFATVFGGGEEGEESPFSAIGTAIENAAPLIEEAFTNLITALQPIIDAFNEWITSGTAAEEMSTLLSAAIDVLAIAISAVVSTVADVITGITDLVTWLNSGNDAAEALKTVVVALTTAFVAYKTALAIATLIDTVKTAMLALRDATILEQAAQAALNLVMSLNPIGLIIAAISALVAAFLYLWNTNEDFRNFWIGLWNKIVEVFSGAVNGIVKFFKETLPNAINDFVNKAKSFGENLVKGFGEGITNMLTWIKDKVNGFGQSVLDAIKNFFGIHSPSTAFADIGENLIKGLWNGINSMSNWITEKIQGFNEDVLNGIKEFFGIHSPSTVMRDKIGKNLSLGLAEGIDDSSKNVLSSANTLSQDISNALDTTYRVNAISGSISQESSGNIQTIASVADIPKVLNNQNIAANGGNMTIILELDKQQFAKAVYKYNNSETQRVGLKLAKGV